jgi:hypothetical protein
VRHAHPEIRGPTQIDQIPVKELQGILLAQALTDVYFF